MIIEPSSLTEGPNSSSSSQPPDNPSLINDSNSPITVSIAGNSNNVETLPHETIASAATSKAANGCDVPSLPVHSLTMPTVLIPASSKSLIHSIKSASLLP